MAKKINRAVMNKSKKGVRIRNKSELVNFLNAYGVAKQMKFFASLLLPNNYKFKLHFSVGEDSYTDFKDITIGIPEYMCGRTKEEILADAKWRTAHESGHLIYSDKDVYYKFIKDFSEYMNTTYQLNEGLCAKVGANIINAIEDGREEFMMVTENPGLLKYFTFGRGLWWYNNDTKDIQDGTEVQRELFDTLFTIATLSTMGTLPKNYAEIYGENDELMDMIKSMNISIKRYVNNPDAVDAIKHLWTLVNTIEDWLVNLMNQIPESDMNDLMDNLQQQAGANGSPMNDASGSANNGGNSSGNNSSGNNNSGNNSGNSNQTNPIHKSFTNNNDDENGDGDSNTNFAESDGNSSNGGRIDYVEDDDNSFIETDMDRIVEEGIRNHQEDIIEEEYDSVTQADWDDLLQNSQIGEEDDGTYDEQLAADVETYYQTLDENKRGGEHWDVGFHVKKYAYDPEPTPNSIRLEAKKLNKEFAEIFLNKRGFDSRNRRRGRLYTGDLYKLWLQDYSLFEKKGTPRATDYVFYLLMDGSGSMSGKKFTEALRACSLVEEALKNIAPVKIVVFDYDHDVNHRIVKDFKQESQRGNYSWTFSNRQRSGCANMDGFSIRVATKELEKRPESRKVLITLSDGLPNGPWNYSGTRGENDVSDAVESARSSGITLFNIYFAESASERMEYLPGFKKMYKEKGIISCAPKDIGSELLRVIKRELRR